MSRFDFPAFGLTNSTTPVPSEPVAAAPPSATYGGGYGAPATDGGFAYRGPTVFNDGAAQASGGYQTYQGGPYAGTSRKNVEVARLPDVPVDQSGYGGTYGDAGGYDTSASFGGYETTDDGRVVIVRKGDSLYKIARDYNVSMSELMRINHLPSPSVRIGQRITLPSAGKARTARSLYKAKPVLAAPAQSDYSLAGDGESYKVQSGDSLYGIARRFNVRAEDLAEANGIDDPSKLRVGQSLRIPGAAGGASYADQEPQPKKRVAAIRPNTTIDEPSDSGYTPIDTQDSGYDSEATAAPVTSDDEGPASSDETTDQVVARSVDEDSEPEARTDARFRWPVKGRIVGKFGDTLDGGRNDGINVAVPLGTDVKAAENGVVAYAGDELKGYGKLVLIRHADNWVSAYAHNDEITVKRGDTVSRGQVIARAGKTGDVDQPQLHFELRKGSQPVDPLPHMSGG
ncbi:MAG: LysM peptidoglycan-binding domain-containing M23 family metallopeptidase [Hyphomicrobiaceae bacterium]